MSDNQPDETSTDEAPTAKPVARQVGRQTLENKSIQGQVITHTIVKPLPDGGSEG
ncbi:hypothetical protein ACFWXK_11625 [Streptomyces sp. NPDC059070]|uniref:hypothetical protein n=1 Tax=unclassified Streptomyces TaxID=2593676 RepID=UPI0034E196F3